MDLYVRILTALTFLVVHVQCASVCPSGQIRHLLPDTPTESRCCLPWNYPCPPGYPYTVCSMDGGWDHCSKCQPGFIQPEFSDTSHPMSCYKDDDPDDATSCDEGNIPVILPNGDRGCRCDRSKDYYSSGDLPVCDFAPRPCAKGKERQLNASCTYCVLGTYKDWNGKGLCKPITNCASEGKTVHTPSRTDADNECSSTVPTAAEITTTTSPKILPTTTTVTNNTDTPTPEPVFEAGQDLTWLLAVFIPGVIIAVFFVICCRVRKKCCCAATYAPIATNQNGLYNQNCANGIRQPPNGESDYSYTGENIPLRDILPRTNGSAFGGVRPAPGEGYDGNNQGTLSSGWNSDDLDDGSRLYESIPADSTPTPPEPTATPAIVPEVTDSNPSMGRPTEQNVRPPNNMIPPPPARKSPPIPSERKPTPLTTPITSSKNPITTPTPRSNGTKPCCVVPPQRRPNCAPERAPSESSLNSSPDASPLLRLNPASSSGYDIIGAPPSHQGEYNLEDLGVMEFPDYVAAVPPMPVELEVMRVMIGDQPDATEEDGAVPEDDSSDQTYEKGT